MVRAVVSDTNIFIDLVKLKILDAFFSLPWEIHTTDLVLYELTDSEQFEAVRKCGDSGQLIVGSFTSADVEAIIAKSSHPGCPISLTDFSVIHYAQTHKYSILSGDRKLRVCAEKEGLEVHGILFVLSALVKENMLSLADAIALLEELKTINKRLPVDLIDDLIRQVDRLQLQTSEKGGCSDSFIIEKSKTI